MHTARTRDRGAILPLVLVVTIVLGGVVAAIATFSVTSLRFGKTAEDRSDRLAAADAGMRYAIDQIKLRNGCVFDDTIHVLPGITTDFNGATAEVVCNLVSDGLDDGQLFAVVATGEGVPASEYLLKSQSGGGSTLPKTLGGPVYLSRVTDEAMDMTAPLIIENGMLYYYDGTGDLSAGCASITQSQAITNAEGELSFKPDVIYGPWCLRETWKDKFVSPWVPDLTGLPERHGDIPLPDPNGSYTDFSLPGLGDCRVFEPGRYTEPPDVQNEDAYFKSGDYLFDFPNSDPTFFIKQGRVTMGTFDGVIATMNERANSGACELQQSLDTFPDGHGATIYLAGRSHIEVAAGGALEIHARQQANFYVSVQALCNPSTTWCRSNGDPNQPAGFVGGDGGLSSPHTGCDATCATAKPSQLTTSSGSARSLYTNSGNGKEFIAHGYFYTPLAKTEFGNATNTAEQKMLGGLVAGQVYLQSSASATNFEIGVPTSPITGKVAVTSTATKNGGTTQIRAILEFRYEELDPDDRVRVNSWRVCEGSC